MGISGINTPNKKNVMLFFCVYAGVVCLQTLHFHVYFKQPLSTALYWGLVDWSVWFILSGSVWYVCRRLDAARVLMCLGLFVVLSGSLQIIVASTVYGMISGWEDTLSDSFLKATNKRWLQNLMIGLCFAGLIRHWLGQEASGQQGHIDPIEQDTGNPSPTGQAQLRVTDGRTSYFVLPHEISYIRAEGNYITLMARGRSITLRQSLKSFLEPVSEAYLLQVNRSVVVGVQGIERFEKYSRSSYQVVLRCGETFTVGRTYLRAVKDRLMPAVENDMCCTHPQ